MNKNDDKRADPIPEVIGIVSKKIKKPSKPRNRGFKPLETQDYTLTYERNEKTGRMNKVWTCKIVNCNKQFRRVCSLKEHLRIHKAIKSFSCDLCGKSWVQKGNRDRHQAAGNCLQK